MSYSFKLFWQRRFLSALSPSKNHFEVRLRWNFKTTEYSKNAHQQLARSRDKQNLIRERIDRNSWRVMIIFERFTYLKLQIFVFGKSGRRVFCTWCYHKPCQKGEGKGLSNAAVATQLCVPKEASGALSATACCSMEMILVFTLVSFYSGSFCPVTTT